MTARELFHSAVLHWSSSVGSIFLSSLAIVCSQCSVILALDDGGTMSGCLKWQGYLWVCQKIHSLNLTVCKCLFLLHSSQFARRCEFPSLTFNILQQFLIHIVYLACEQSMLWISRRNSNSLESINKRNIKVFSMSFWWFLVQTTHKCIQ